MAAAYRVVDAQAALVASKFPDKMSRYWSTLHGAKRLQHWFSLFPSLLLYHPTTPPPSPAINQQAQPGNPLL